MSRLIDNVKDDDAKNRYRQLMTKVRARALLNAGDVVGALAYIRNIEDRTARVGYYLSATTATQKKRDSALTLVLLNEARTAIPQVDRNGLDVRLLLAFAPLVARTSPDEAQDFIQSAIVSLNSLTRKASTPTRQPTSGAEVALSSLNDPSSFLNAPEFENAFSSFGSVDLNRALIEARTIDLKALQLNARLEAIQGFLRNEWKKPNSKTTLPVPAPKAASN